MPNMRDITFATINLWNLQIPGGTTYDDDPAIPDTEDGRSYYQARIEWLAALIRRVDADVLAFQELWSRQALVDVFEAAGLAGEYTLLARDAPGRGQPQVAAAVRFDRNGNPTVKAEDARWISQFPETFRMANIREKHGAQEEISISIDKFSRPILNFTVQPQGNSPKPPTVTVYCVHLKSKGGTKLQEIRKTDENGRFVSVDTVLDHHYGMASTAVSHTRRVLEAGALRVLLDGQMAGVDENALTPTIVIGDVNDGTNAITTEMLTGQPGYRLAAKSTAGKSADKGLYTAETLQQYRSQKDVYYTYIFKNKLETLDQILVSEEFYDHSQKRQWSFKELEVINDHLNPSLLKEGKKSGKAIDHGVVRAAFDWNPIAAEIEKLLKKAEEIS